MTWTHHGRSIPLEVYHGVPSGWYASDILAEHAGLRGDFDLTIAEVTEPGAPSWMPERAEWLRYRATLYRVAEGVRASDPACIELAVRFIELRHIGSYSGYIRSRLCRALKNAPLNREQQDRLHVHFAGFLTRGERTVEFRDFFPLWNRFLTASQREALLASLESRGPEAVAWAAERLRSN